MPVQLRKSQARPNFISSKQITIYLYIIYNKREYNKLLYVFPTHRCLVSKLFDVCPRSTLEEMEKQDEVRVAWGTGIAGHVAESGEPVNIPDAYQVCSSILFIYYIFFVVARITLIKNIK